MEKQVEGGAVERGVKGGKERLPMRREGRQDERKG